MLDTEANKAEPHMTQDCCYQNKLDIALVKQDLKNIRDTFEQSEEVITRLEQVSNDISRNASLHEQKINTQDKLITDIEKVLDTHRQESANELQKMNNRINTVNTELSDKINKTERTILIEIHQMNDDLTKKITEINMYRYMVVGAIALGAFIISKAIDISKLFH